MILSLDAGGMKIRDIQLHLESTIGTELSRETFSEITDEVLEEVIVWQQQPLDPIYPIRRHTLRVRAALQLEEDFTVDDAPGTLQAVWKVKE